MPTLIKNGKNYSGTSVSLTQAEYDALSTTEKNNGTVYFITDSDAVLDASDVAVDGGTVQDLVKSLAEIETSPATANHYIGEYIVHNGQMYNVVKAISAGESLVVGDNINIAKVGVALYSLERQISGVPVINYSYTTSENANLVLKRYGKVVMLTGSIKNTFKCPQYTWLFALPAAYLPISPISITPLNGTEVEWFFIDSNGQVSPQNGDCEVGTRYFTATWLTA